MDINSDIDTLINVLDPAHKIILNDENMIVIKLHKNKKFSEWLTLKDAMPVIKPYHTSGKLYDNAYAYPTTDVTGDRTGHPSEPLFITIGIVKNINSKQVNVSCCNIDMKNISNVLFNNEDSSGIIFNGSFFYLEKHIKLKYYGMNDSGKLNYPIGYFIHNMDHHGNIIYNDDKSDVLSLQKGTEITLSIIDDMMSVLIFNSNGDVQIQEFRDYTHHLHNNDQVLMGNTLISNGIIKMTEDKINTVILLNSLVGVPKHTVGKICKFDGNPYTPLEINDIATNSDVHFCSDGYPPVIIKFSPLDIEFPFCVKLLAKFYSEFGGLIRPGYPSHASDPNPRTCVFTDSNGNFFVMHVEGRKTSCGGVGVDLFDLAKICKSMGAVNAINLDGGSSSKLIWKEKNNPFDYIGLDSYSIADAVVIRPSGASVGVSAGVAVGVGVGAGAG